PASQQVSLSPTNSGPFTNGVWAGEVAVLDLATNVQLIAQDTNRHSGVSNPFTAGLPLDSDGDGIPDDWELAYGFNPFDPSDASQDADGDGLTNVQEFLAGGDPLGNESRMRIQQVRVSGQEVHITFYGVRPGQHYRLERR